jgi:hypothetical protein
MSQKRGLRIVSDTEERKRGRSAFRASIDGYEFGLSATEAALVSSLYGQLGQVIPYARFSLIIQSDCTRWKALHRLRQYMLTIKEKLRRSGAPYVITNSREFGYALCKIAPKRAG